MNTVSASHPAVAPAPETDMGPLAWLLDQISDNLQSARTALKRAAQQQDDGVLGSVQAEKTGLRTARTQVHQAAGAIELLGFFGAARLMQAAENALDQLIDHPEKLDNTALQRFEAGFNALVDFLESQRAGKNEPALKLYPQYRDLMELAQAERIHPADLWDYDWTWPDAPPVTDAAGAPAPMLTPDDRAQFEMGLLQVLRGQQTASAMQTLDAVARRAQASSAGPTASLWWLARGLFEAIGSGLLTPDLDIKRLLNRLNLQLRSQLQGQSPAPQRLGHDLTFFCAQSLHGNGDVTAQSLPVLRAIDNRLHLAAAPFADYHQSHFGLIDPALVQQVRKRVQTLRDAWSALAGHAQTHLDPARMARLVDLTQALEQPLHALTPGSEALPQSLAGLFKKISARSDFLTPERALDVATAILFLEITFAHFRPEEQRFLERSQILARRLDQSANGQRPDPLAGWMEDLFRQASESQTMGSVVQELRADMSTVEKLLDAYFRDPSHKPDLAQVPRLLSQMRGVFSVLGVDVASQALSYLRTEIDSLVADDVPTDNQRFDALASNIGVLGFLVDMLSYQPELAKTLFVFDNDKKELRAVVPSTQRTAPPTLQQDVEHAAQQLKDDIAQGLPPEQAQQRLAQLHAEAALAGVPDLPAQVLSVPSEGVSELPSEPHTPQEIDAAPAQEASATPAEPTVTPESAQEATPPAEPEDDAEDELIDIFLEEAREVIASGHEQLQQLHANLDDEGALTSLRRAFHTLKGSSRMVGLRDYGEAAWALEQVFNRQIADQHRASPPLLNLAAHALTELGEWTAAIQQGQAEAFSSEPLRRAAEAYAAGESAEPALPTLHDAPNEPSMAAEPAAVEAESPSEPAAPELAAPEPEALHEPTDFNALFEGIDLELPHHTQAPEPMPSAEMSAVEAPPAEMPSSDAPAVELPQVEEADMAEFEAAVSAQHAAPADTAADTDIAPVPPENSDEGEPGYRQIGELRIPTPLYNIYLAEADELSRHLYSDIHDWLTDPAQALGDAAVISAHKLAGSSATVGLRSVADLASQTEHALDALRDLPAHAARPVDLDALAQAASDIKQLLHQFAAGFLKPVQAELLTRLEALQEAALAQNAQPSAESVTELTHTAEPAVQPEQIAAPELALATLEPASAETPQPQVSATQSAASADQLVDTIDPDLFPIFEEEANELLPALAASLRQWEQHPQDTAPAAQAMRALHTLKGSARMAGAMQLGDLAHSLESDIDTLTANAPVSEADLAELLGRFDHLNTRFDRLCSAAQRGESQLADLPVATVSEVFTPSAEPDTAASAQPLPAVAVTTAATPAAAEPVNRVLAPRIAAQAVRVRAGLLDRLVNQAGEITISRARLENEFGAIRASVGDLSDNLDRLRQQVREIEIQAEAQMSAQVQAARDENRDFDPLEFDRFTRAQELTRMMAESVNDIAMVQGTLSRLLREVDDDMTRQARQTRELQRDLLRTRMVEFDSLSERLYRTVRQAAKDLNKAVRLEIIGGAIELDRGVLERVSSSFDHLLRNAVAHGIETAEERKAAGKPEVGTLTLSLRQDGNEVVITLADDGRGLNYAAIRAKAERLGLLAPGQNVSEAELTQLVFRPNFSSAESTTAVAGRGVGLDVVRTEVNALGGRVLLDNQPGSGARFTLLLPLTTAITHVVLLRTGAAVYAVPANLVDIVLRFKPEQIANAARTLSIEYANNTLPFYWLGALLGQSGGSSEPFGKSVPVVVIRSATQRVAIQVDEVVGNREVVVKNLGPQLSRVPGLAGISVLPNGDAALIYNPVALAAVYGADASARMQAVPLTPVAPSADAAPAAVSTSVSTSEPSETPIDASGRTPGLPPTGDAAQAAKSGNPLIMVVDDSITVRRVTQRFLQRNGYLVQLAKDGLDALEQLQQISTLPNVILLDIEMPRMDGFDLTRNIRADSRLQKLPIIMITSRIADKHRNYAAQLGVNHYLGKPYSETELLELIRTFTQSAVNH
ncbi:Hpt domain-containing protein [Thiomonas sp.]|uniref:Hpt domain-containing protein n=2 Tax=unclassified Thiomonas TaxID=2625466 RepID=UPI000BDBF4E8|nr:Hpt domain-containing protein [Thiomonas sp.]MDD4999618.1 Hpt domain-containing protein [Thiomonas arsenitoxydans]OZB71336.1 MAG: histidine kinase [Thiomonas sp. 13-64-67]